ncbi:MAG: hypothetical protein ACC628_03025 [Pirellulaceae bacterium]
MGFWDLVHYSWFAFLGLAVFAVFGAVIWDSMAAKNRRKKATRPAVTETGLEEEPASDEPAMAASEDAELQEVAVPASEAGIEENGEQIFN